MKEWTEIYEQMRGTFAQRAGFVPSEGCDSAVRLYALAAELQSLLMQADWVLDQSFPQTAQGTYLDYHAETRGITRAAAEKAVGTLRFAAADKVTAALAVTDLDGGALTGYTVTVENAYGTESVFQAGEPVQLAAGEYTFRVEAGNSGARGTMTLETDGTVRIAGKAVTALAVPAGKEWLKAPILHRTTGKLEGDAYTSEAGGGHAAVYYVPDAVSGSYLYCVPGSDLTESGTYSTAAVRTSASEKRDAPVAVVCSRRPIAEDTMMWSLVVFVIVTVPPEIMIMPSTVTLLSATASVPRPSVMNRSPSIVASDSVQLSEMVTLVVSARRSAPV